MLIYELTDKLQFLKGIGPILASRFARLGLITVKDLLLYSPRRYEDRSCISPLARAWHMERANVVAQIIAFDYIGKRGPKILKIYIEDASARAALVCFGRNYLERVLTIGQTIFIAGVFKYRFGEIQSSNFEYIEFDDFKSNKQGIIPFYPLTEGLSQRTIQRACEQTLKKYSNLIEDELPPYLLQRYTFPPKKEALKQLHFPESFAHLKKARQALKYEELFYIQLLILRRSLKRKVNRRQRQTHEGKLLKTLLAKLPFSLTPGQVNALQEIKADLFSSYPMTRLLQGDVGCGKTLVAVLAALTVIEAGEQVAFMVPTELLARQHAQNIATLVEPFGLQTALVTGTLSGESRSQLLAAIAGGQVNLIIGTHALYSEDVVFAKLGLVIIDEQHRFGVLQRQALLAKGKHPDLLLMTATPIPRSLALTAFGDLEVSLIKDRPHGRLPVITHLAREGNEKKVYERVLQELQSGRQAYFVYPLIEESDKLSLKNAVAMCKQLQTEVFPQFRVALIHSRLAEEEKRQVMEQFIRHELDILVATSVVEVGVDVANATCIVIEHAERFGLSTLHQLRGRVGRANFQSYAFLIYAANLTDEAKQRLKIMKETTDGFRIAEEDLKIRGPGALLGVEQSGYFRLNFADLTSDVDLLLQARADAKEILQKDPGLLAPEHAHLRRVLEEFTPFPEEFADSG